jgi:hypothetical protein
MPKSPINQLAFVLFTADLLLLASYVTGTFLLILNPLIYRLVNLDAEGSLGAWFSASQLFLTGAVFGAAALFRPKNPVGPFFLTVCALAFIFLSADEAVSIHEKITLLFRNVEFLPRFSGNHGIWIPLYLLAGLLFFTLTGRDWLRLWRTQRNSVAIFFLGLALFAFGAVVLEIVSYGALRDAANQRYYLYQVLLEEAFELAGVTTILIGSIKICFKDELERH